MPTKGKSPLTQSNVFCVKPVHLSALLEQLTSHVLSHTKAMTSLSGTTPVPCVVTAPIFAPRVLLR